MNYKAKKKAWKCVSNACAWEENSNIVGGANEYIPARKPARGRYLASCMHRVRVLQNANGWWACPLHCADGRELPFLLADSNYFGNKPKFNPHRKYVLVWEGDIVYYYTARRVQTPADNKAYCWEVPDFTECRDEEEEES